MIAQGRPDQLKQQAGGPVLQAQPSRAQDIDAVAGALAALTGARPLINRDTGWVSVPVADPSVVAVAVRRLDELGLPCAELAVRRPSLDEVFLSLTGRGTETTRPADEAPARRGRLLRSSA